MLGLGQRTGQRALGCRGHARSEPAQLLQALGQRGCGEISGQLGERRVERDPELEGGFALAAIVEVQPGPEGELFAGQRELSSGQERLWVSGNVLR